MTFVGCDLHTRMQRVAVLDTEAGKVSERQVATRRRQWKSSMLPRPAGDRRD